MRSNIRTIILASIRYTLDSNETANRGINLLFAYIVSKSTSSHQYTAIISAEMIEHPHFVDSIHSMLLIPCHTRYCAFNSIHQPSENQIWHQKILLRIKKKTGGRRIPNRIFNQPCLAMVYQPPTHQSESTVENGGQNL